MSKFVLTMETAILLLVLLTSCAKEQCVVCIEFSTKVQGEFCGSESECVEFENGLKAVPGQIWDCFRR